jgi:hypothetical protein
MAIYLNYLDPSWTPDNTILFSLMPGFEIDQMLIPSALLKSLSFDVGCVSRQEPELNSWLSLYGDANWGNMANVKGSRTK